MKPHLHTARKGSSTAAPEELDERRLVRRALQVILLLGVLVLITALTPGLGEMRSLLRGADPWWLALGVLFEVLSACSYVLMFRPAFCPSMPWRNAAEIGFTEVGTGSIIPASGAGGVALGAWVLSRAGMAAETIARRSVAFLLLKSAVNFVAVIIVGVLVFAHVLGPSQSIWLTLLPAVLSVVAIAGVALIARLPMGEAPEDDDSRPRKLWAHARRAVVSGVAEAGVLLRRRDPVLLAGIVGYWAWDNLVLWATFHAIGEPQGASVILLGYLIGQLGGLLPIPGGIGGIDGGLIGTLVVFGAAGSAAAAAVLAYRIILFWIPLLLGTGAFISLRRSMGKPEGFLAAAG